MNLLGFGLQSLGTWDLVVILGIGLLLFGRRLPEVGRNLGKGIVEFKKGLKGIEDATHEGSVSGVPQVRTMNDPLPPAQG